MKQSFNFLFSIVLFVFAVELTGCSAPPPPPKSAKSEIGSATSAIETAKALTARSQFEQAIIEYDRALEEIGKGDKFAKGTELTQLDNLKKEVRQKKTELETLAMRAAANKQKKSAVDEPPKVEDPEIARKKLEQQKAAEIAAQNKDLLATPTKTAPAAKVDDAEEVEAANKDAAKKDGAKVAGKTEEGVEAPKVVKKDKTGVFPDITEKSPELEVVKVERFGRFSVAYCQLYNRTDNGKRITAATFFKDRDNQMIIEPRTTVAFPYEGFSVKVKDLIADQSVRNLAANAEEVGGHEFLQFVCVGESLTDDKAKLVAKVYVNILYSDGSTVEAVSTPRAAAEVNDLVKGLVKKPDAPKPPAPKK